jgi:phage tail-like protein
MPTSGRQRWGEDPARSFKFNVVLTLDGVSIAAFTECSGLSLEREVETYAEGGVNDYVHTLPVRTKYANIVLKRGIIKSDKLWQWYQKGIRDGQVERLNLSVKLYNAKGEVLQNWDIVDAYPVKWVGPTLNSGSAEMAVETIELAHHGLKLGQV